MSTDASGISVKDHENKVQQLNQQVTQLKNALKANEGQMNELTQNVSKVQI